jgi:heptosyltransferase-1
MPAVSDAARARPGIEIDWVVEEGFADLPALHPAVGAVIPVAFRRWRRAPLASLGEARAFVRRLRQRRYDLVLDSQGLMKSAAGALAARGPAAGFDRVSAREPLAALVYGRRYPVPRDRHAIDRQRALFAAALGYPLPETPPDYGLAAAQRQAGSPYVVFAIHTTWASKRWPLRYWRELAERAAAASLAVRLPWHSDAEQAASETLSSGLSRVAAVRTGRLRDLVEMIAGAEAVVAPDSGAAHLAAACGVPAVVLYGSTAPGRTGTVGPAQRHLAAAFACSPCLARECRYRGPSEVEPACYGSLPPSMVWHALSQTLGRG